MNTLILAILLCGQIEAPAEADAYKLITAKLTAKIPEGTYIEEGSWNISGETAKQVADFRAIATELIWTGTPGVYTISFDGVLLKDVTFKDGDGNQITIKSYLGRLKGSAKCVIKGDSGPDPPVPPVGKYRIMLYYNAKQFASLPQSQKNILNSTAFRDYLTEQGHVLVEQLDPTQFTGSVPDKYKSWVEAVKDDPLPRIAFAPKDTEGYVIDYALPLDMALTKALINSPSTWKAVQK